MPRWDFGTHATMVDGETFACVAELETRQAARLQYAVSLLTIHRGRNGHGADPDNAAEQLAEVVRPLIRDSDLIEAAPSGATVRVLLVGGELEDLDKIVRRIIAEISLYRLDEKSTPVVVRIGGSCFPATAGTSRDLLVQADTLAEEARQEQAPHSTYRLRPRSDR
jgi:hypothetical protein